MNKNYKAIYSKALSSVGDPRYIIVDTETGEILDDAQGYGFKSVQKAYACFAYKNVSPQEKKSRELTKKAVQKWCKDHKSFVGFLEDDAFHIAKGSYGPDDNFDEKWVQNAFIEAGYKDLPFTAREFLKYWSF